MYKNVGSIEHLKTSLMAEEKFEWRKWQDKLPWLSFKSDWQVKIIPPFTAAIIRFLVQKDKGHVSVYFDGHEILGAYGGPHWEIYPDCKGDNARFDINDIDGLIKAIEKSLVEQNDK